MRMRIQAAAFFALTCCFAAAEAADPALLKAIAANDIAALDAAAATAADPGEKSLAEGTALALRHRDGEAFVLLMQLAQSGAERDIRKAAYMTAAEITLRQGRFAQTAGLMQRAAALGGGKLEDSAQQTLGFVTALSPVPPMRVLHKASGSLAATRDKAHLLRAKVRIGGSVEDAIIDSGAGFSTVSESAAKRIGLKMLDEGASVGSSSMKAVTTRLGVAERLAFGKTVLTDVVFIVLPDAALSFAEGAYTIDAIIGLPVFEALGRIEVARTGGKEVLRYGPRPGKAVGSNLLLSGVQPIVLAKVDGAAEPMRFFIDTGANDSMFNASLLQDYPVFAAAAQKKTLKLGGAGGIATDEQAQILPAVTLHVGSRSVALKDVSVRSEPETGHHGTIGQDVMGKGWVLDFENMRFSIAG